MFFCEQRVIGTGISSGECWSGGPWVFAELEIAQKGVENEERSEH
jgi:hypothetical protein